MGHRVFSEFLTASYSYLAVTDDFNHFMKCHGDDLKAIEEALTTPTGKYAVTRCGVRHCGTLRRHCGRNRRAKGVDTEQSVEVEFAVDVMDRYHRMVFHLYDLGLRLERYRKRMDGVDEDEDDDDDEEKEKEDLDHIGPDEVDKALQSDRDQIAQKQQQFAVAAPDIVVDQEGPNKFMIGAADSGKECLVEGIFREIGKEHGKEAVSKMEGYRNDNDFDSDAIEQDVDDLEHSNFYAAVSHKAAVETMKKLVATVQSMCSPQK